VTIIDNGYLGDNYSGSYRGIVFNGNQNAIAMAGLIFGQEGQAYGSCFEDFYNETPIAGFYPHSYFNQYANYTMALSSNPDSKTFVETFSNTGQDFVYLKAHFFNYNMNVYEIYPGIFADWDVGNYPTNRGGYVPSMNLFYIYDNESTIDTSYYGIMAILVNETPLAPNSVMGLITDSVAWNQWELYYYMTTTIRDIITTDADYRMYACIGPYSFPAGDTLSILVAIVVGISLEDLLANAQAALDYGVYTPVENTNIALLNFSLYQNYPNPFNPLTKIKYQIPELSFVSIKVYDVLGNEITTLVNEEKTIGSYEVELNAMSLPSGIYFYRLQAGDYIETKKMVLLK